MLPSAYALPAAIVFVIGGMLACFAGFRLFRVVLGIYGFILGALVTTATVGTSSHLALGLAALVGGLAGAALMIAAYFVGVALVGAGVAAIAVNYAWRLVHGEPPWWLIIIAAVIGALVALSVTRYVVIIGTAFGGAWTMLIGSLALVGDRAAVRAAAEGSVWVVYPLEPAPGRWWVTALWLALAVVGVLTQLSITSKTGGPKRSSSGRSSK